MRPTRRPMRPKPIDAHGLPLQFHERRLPERPVGVARPFAGAHGVGVELHVVAQLQQQGEDELRHRGGPVGGDVGDDNSLPPRRVDVDHVVAGGQDADVFQVRQARQRVRGERRLVGEHGGGAASARGDLGGGRAVVDHDLAELAQGVPGEISRIQAVPVKHYDFHASSLSGVIVEYHCRVAGLPPQRRRRSAGPASISVTLHSPGGVAPAP